MAATYPTALDVTYRRRPGGHALVLRGDIDLHTWPILEAHLDHLIADGSGDVSLDLHGVGFVDSSGLAALVDAHSALEDGGRRLLLARVSGSAREILSISSLNAVGDFR